MKKYKYTIAGVIFLGFIIVVAIILAGGARVASLDTSLAVPVSSNEWMKGKNPAAKVVIVEYSDFQCPACGAYYPIVKRLMSEFGDRVMLVYRHFPLRQVHQHADTAARAAEAAGMQGKFWEMHDLLFENQATWSLVPFAADGSFEKFAENLGLDVQKFNVDRKSQAVESKVQRSYEGGVASSVDHTPTFFLNGKELQNPRSYEEFRNIILDAINNS